MEINKNSNQIVIDVDLFNAIMKLAREGEAMHLADSGVVRRVQRHVNRFNLYEGDANRNAKKHERTAWREKRDRTLAFLKRNLGKEVYIKSDTGTYKPVIVVHRSPANKHHALCRDTVGESRNRSIDIDFLVETKPDNLYWNKAAGAYGNYPPDQRIADTLVTIEKAAARLPITLEMLIEVSTGLNYFTLDHEKSNFSITVMRNSAIQGENPDDTLRVEVCAKKCSGMTGSIAVTVTPQAEERLPSMVLHVLTKSTLDVVDYLQRAGAMK